ncbi:MAG TPA: hypothetical protein VFM93_05645 [Candidatus Limnocylindria bacterium]|nr:hypothetical protein [Candidatus Limnocylindria bacterium]
MSDKMDVSGSVATGKALDDVRLGAAIPAGDPTAVSAAEAWPEHALARLNEAQGAAELDASAAAQWPEHAITRVSAAEAGSREGDAYLTADEAGRDAGTESLADDLVIVDVPVCEQSLEL